MTSNSWQTFFQILSFVGAFLILVSTIGGWHFNKKIEHERDKKTDRILSETQNMDAKIDMLVARGIITAETAKQIKIGLSDTLTVTDKLEVKKTAAPPDDKNNMSMKDQIEVKLIKGKKSQKK